MPRFNIAMLPEDPTLQPLFVAVARQHFKDCQDGYLLSTDALAHATLCQFDAADEAHALALFNAWPAKIPLTLTLSSFDLSAGKSDHSGFYWAAFLVEKTSELLALQKSCHDYLEAQGCTTHTNVEGYTPHVTLARITTPHIPVPPSLDLTPQIATIPCRSAVGPSTPNGAFMRRLA